MKKKRTKAGQYKEYYKEYDASQAGRDRKKKYRTSPKGIESERRYALSRKGKRSNKRYQLKKYGITEIEYSTMVIKQDGRCAICSISIEGRNCHLDHNHINGEIRGLLCDKCNQGIGCLRGDEGITLLINAINYLSLYP